MLSANFVHAGVTASIHDPSVVPLLIVHPEMVLEQQNLKIHKILHMLTGAPGPTTTKPNGQPSGVDGFKWLVCEGLMNCQGINESGHLSDLTVFFVLLRLTVISRPTWLPRGIIVHTRITKRYWVLIRSRGSIIVRKQWRNEINDAAGGQR